MKYFYINSKIRLLNKRVFLSPKQDYDIPNMGEVDQLQLLPLPNELVLQHNCHDLSLGLITKVEMLKEMGPVAMLEHKMRVTCPHMRWEAYWKQGEACLRLFK